MPYPRIYLYRQIANAKLFIDENFAEKINLDNIADKAHFSKFHFVRIFKSTYGKTPHEYLTTVRINHAKQLLKNGVPLGDICFAVGFDSSTTFSGLFKKMTGITPGAFQEKEQSIKEEIKIRPLHFIPGCFAASMGWNKNSNFEE